MMRPSRHGRPAGSKRSHLTAIIAVFATMIGICTCLVAAPATTAVAAPATTPSVTAPKCPSGSTKCVLPDDPIVQGTQRCESSLIMLTRDAAESATTRINGVVVASGATYSFAIEAGEQAVTSETIAAPKYFPAANGGKSQTYVVTNNGPANTPYCADAPPACKDLSLTIVRGTANTINLVKAAGCIDVDSPKSSIYLASVDTGFSIQAWLVVVNGVRSYHYSAVNADCHGVDRTSSGYVADNYKKASGVSIKITIVDPPNTKPSPVC